MSVTSFKNVRRFVSCQLTPSRPSKNHEMRESIVAKNMYFLKVMLDIKWLLLDILIIIERQLVISHHYMANLVNRWSDVFFYKGLNLKL